MGEQRIFNGKKRRLLRTRIPGAEVASGVGLLGVLALTIGWIAAQGDNFNAAERDLPYEVLAARPVEDRLYRLPVRPWVPPGAAFSSGAVGRRVDLGLFPGEILAGGWAISSRPRRFGADNLYEKINGEADKFIRQGFRELHYIALKAPGGKDEISIELFDQGSFAGGLGIFSAHRSGDRKILREGQTLYYTTPVGAIGFNGRYFFRIAGNAATSAVQGKTGELVRAFAGLRGQGKGDGAMPLGFRVFTAGLGMDPARISYQARNVFQYDFARDFWFGSLKAGKPGRLFLHRAASAQAARLLFGRIAGEHGEDHKVLKRTNNRVLMRHGFLKTHFAMTVKGPLVYGVENEPDAGRTASLLTNLARALRDEK